ncbi:MAG: DUF302 domain-containing protein [Actinomycetota bacterium]|nr:DUF302 domain-containing protein [Actinomycetota bacterium]
MVRVAGSAAWPTKCTTPRNVSSGKASTATVAGVCPALKKKLDEDMENYLILGACNPPLAHRALGVDRQIGLLLPCNVVVRDDTEHEGTVIVEAMNPDIMVKVTDAPGLPDVAGDASTKLQAAMETLKSASGAMAQ